MTDFRVLLIGIGDELRGDDGAGIELVRRLYADGGCDRLHCIERSGEATELLEAWRGWSRVIVVDAMRSGAAPGTLARLEITSQRPEGTSQRPEGTSEPLTGLARGASTHALGLADAVELGRVLESLPAHLILHAVEAVLLEAGSPLSTEVRQALPALEKAVLEDARMLLRISE